MIEQTEEPVSLSSSYSTPFAFSIDPPVNMSFLNTFFALNYQSELQLPAKRGWSAAEMEQLGLKVAIEILHDHKAVIFQNPLVKRATELPPNSPDAVDYKKLAEEFDSEQDSHAVSPWRQFEIVDELPLIFGYTKNLIYHSALRGLLDGFEGFTNAGSGVLLYGAWRVEPAQDGRAVLIVPETGEVKCNWFLSWYIQMTYPSSHKVMHAKFRENWEMKMGKAMGQQL